MKKIIIAVICAAFVLFGCEREPVTPSNQNPMAGTKWIHSTSSVVTGEQYTVVLEFSENSFDWYKADMNGNYSSWLTTVNNYTYSNGKITFPTTWMMGWYAYMYEAEVSGNKLILKYYKTYNGDVEPDYFTMVFMKK